jgi:uncharacterized repeat protein (TIGR01451 family)
VVTKTFVNKLGEIIILKKNFAGDIINLSGATFEVSPNPYGAGNLTVVDNDANDGNSTLGVIGLKNVKLGHYTVTETAAPDAYLLDPTPQSGDVTAGALTLTLSFTNIKPETKLTLTSNIPEVTAGGNVTLTIKEKNTGDVPLTDVSVVLTGDVLAVLNSFSPGFSSDINNDAVLDIGETWTWSLVVTVTTPPLNVTANGNGTDPFGNFINYDTGYTDERASVTVSTLFPLTQVTITPDVLETLPGGNVILVITEKNTGIDPLGNLTNPYVVLTSNQGLNVTLGNESASFVGGDTNGNGILDIGETWEWSYQTTISVTTTFTATGHGTALGGVDVTFPAYPSEQASKTVQVGRATRTWGFWKTHLFLVNWMFSTASGSPHITSINLGNWTNELGVLQTHVITGNCTYMGLMWSDQSKNSDGTMRTAIDQARIHTAHQALAAIMNSYMPGGAPLPAGVTLASIANTLTNGTIQQIRDLGSVLGAYNESGDTVALDPSMPPTGKDNNGDPQGARAVGAPCYTYWNTPVAPKGKNK